VLKVEGLLGLFTRRKIEQGTIIGEYIGRVISVKQSDTDPEIDARYLFHVNRRGRDDIVIDAGDPCTSAFTRYVNATFSDEQQNTAFFQWSERIFLKATRDIPANTELLTWYGDDTEDIVNWKPH